MRRIRTHAIRHVEVAPQRSTSRANSWSELAAGVSRQTGVDRPGLHDRARGRDQPVEALGGGQLRRSARPPGRRPRSARSCAAACATAAGSQSGASAASSALVELRAGAEEAQRAAEEHDAGVDRLAALDARDDPQRRVLERATRGHVRPPPRTRAGLAAAAVEELARTASPSAHSAGTSAAAAPGRRAPPAARRPPRSSPRRAAARGRGSPGTRCGRGPAGRAPWKAYSAAPWSISHRLPCQRSRFGLRGVRSTLVTERVEPHDVGGELGVRRVGRVVRQRAGQEVDAEVDARAGGDQLLDLRVGLGGAERRVELDQHELGHRQPEPAGQLAGRRSRPRAPSAPGPRRGT